MEIVQRVPAARYHFRELAHAEALRDELPPPPRLCDCPALDVFTRRPVRCTHRADDEEWQLRRDRVVAWIRAEEAAVQRLLCRKCHGTGMTQWRRCGGYCFSCDGHGWSAKGRKLCGTSATT